MELELKNQHLNCYETLLETNLCKEETQESIVPDACPDILHIIDTGATICLKEKVVYDGRVELTGVVTCSIMYCPEVDLGVRYIRGNIPFTCTLDVPGAHSGCRLVINPFIQACDTRILNPRKVLTRADIALSIQVLSPICHQVSQCISCEDTMSVEQLIRKERSCTTTCVEEKNISFNDSLTFPNNRKPAEELLNTKINLHCSESKIIGNKLIFKGDATLCVLYRDVTGDICNVSFDLPFSQIMEVVGTDEDAVCQVNFSLTGYSCELSSEGTCLDVTLDVLAQAIIREVVEIQVLADAYSTRYETTAEFDTQNLYEISEQSSHRCATREVIELDDHIRDICDVNVWLGGVTVHRDGHRVTCKADATTTIIYWNDQGNLVSITSRQILETEIDVPSGTQLSCHCTLSGSPTATVAAGGIELRLQGEFYVFGITTRSQPYVSKLTCDESAPRNCNQHASIVLRMVGQGECLWDIAKTYGTSTLDIVQANDLAEDQLPMGELLLIPKKR